MDKWRYSENIYTYGLSSRIAIKEVINMDVTDKVRLYTEIMTQLCQKSLADLLSDLEVPGRTKLRRAAWESSSKKLLSKALEEHVIPKFSVSQFLGLWAKYGRFEMLITILREEFDITKVSMNIRIPTQNEIEQQEDE